jgi:hypothetical protein
MYIEGVLKTTISQMRKDKRIKVSNASRLHSKC